VAVNALARLTPLAIATLLSGTVLACGAPTPDMLAGRTFLSTAVVAGGSPIELAAGTRIRISFGDDGRIGVNAGCNTMGGGYRLDGATLVVGDAAVTEMGCDAARHAQDDWVFGLVTSGPTVSLVGDELVLVAGTDSIALLDRAVADPDRPLVGPTWTVDSIISGDAVSSMPVGVVATIIFTAEGRVQVATGCNDGGGTYTSDATTITFGDLALTDRACLDAAAQVEAAVLAVLSADRVGYTIEAASLTLLAGSGGLGLVAR
jgi:heat shock protein HslJ